MLPTQLLGLPRQTSQRRRNEGRRKTGKKRASADVIPELTLSSSEDAEYVISPQNVPDSKTLHLSMEGSPTSHLLKVDQVTPEKLAVPKSYSYASTRFRQDPLSITLLLAIRNVLPDSLKLSWTPFNSLTPKSPVSYQLLLTFSSRGTGACTLNWGVVLQCPLNETLCTTDLTTEGFGEQHLDQQPVSTPPEVEVVNGNELGRPEILSCDVTHENVTLVLRKPVVDSCDVWWDAVAVGRTMGSGLQKVPLVGLWQLSEPPQAPPAPNLLSLTPYLTTTSPQCVELSFSHIQTPAAQSPELPLNSHPPARSISHDGQSSCASSKSLRLKGILKQRSTSESSLDEFHYHLGTSAIGGGDLFDFAEFPTESSDSEQEHGSGCMDKRRSNTGLPSSLISPLDPAVVSASWRPPSRRRLRSVNFSRKDENVAFFPHDTVETLHHLLRNKQRNARRSERRHRNNSYTAPSLLPTNTEPCSATAPMNYKQRRQQARQQKRLWEGQPQQLVASLTGKTTMSPSSPLPSQPSLSSSVPAESTDCPHLASEDKKADPTPTEPETPCPKTLNADVGTSKNVAGASANGAIYRWQDLPGAKNLLHSADVAPPSSHQSGVNLHITKCPVSLNADTIFELEDDC
uniref:Uncharacterized protein n=1 Tax=Schistocephalus solidus TaxID=70667 RepID=A0A0X3PQR4_SCHSO